jgi:hypothetical protein
MYPIFKPIDWKHFAPTELRNNSEPWFYKHFVPTGLFKKPTLSSQRSQKDQQLVLLLIAKTAKVQSHFTCPLYFSPASIGKGRRFCRGGSGQVANLVKAHGGL